jgi:hypothetical protein
MNDAEGASAEELEGETRLTLLSAAAGPLRRALAALCARLLDTQGYERLCYARLGDYARERAGVSVRQIQDLAHAHRSFADLPRLERTLVENELPWSKVRILTRVATPENEGAWISHARARPVRELEQAVREARRTQCRPNEPPEEKDEPRVSVRLRCTPAVREKWLQVRNLAECVAGQRLRAEEALECVVAEAFSRVSTATARRHQAHAPPPPPPIRSRPCDHGGPDMAANADARLNADADGPSDEVSGPVSGPLSGPLSNPRNAGSPRLVAECRAQIEPSSDETSGFSSGAPAPTSALIEPLTAGLDEIDAFELDRRLCLAFRLEQALDAEIAPVLRVVTSTEYEWKTRFWTLAGYAGERLGISASKARALLRIERASDICPELREAFRHGRLSWVKAQCLLPLLLLDIPGELASRDPSNDAPADWRRRWIAWAERVTLRRLEGDVERALLLRAAYGEAFARCKADPARAQDPIPESEQQKCAPSIDVDATEQLDWRLPADVAWLFRVAQAEFQARLRAEGERPASESAVFGALLDHAISTWILQDPSRRRPDPVIVRDDYRCAIPGCSSRRNLHDHHVIFRSAGGSDAQGNRITLCAFHHQRGVHSWRLRVQGHAPAGLLFELGLRQDAPPLLRYRSGDVAA